MTPRHRRRWHCLEPTWVLAVTTNLPRRSGERHVKNLPHSGDGRDDTHRATSRPPQNWRRTSRHRQANLARRSSPTTKGGDGNTSRRAMAEEGEAPPTHHGTTGALKSAQLIQGRTYARQRTGEQPTMPAQKRDKSRTSAKGNATSSRRGGTKGQRRRGTSTKGAPGGKHERTDGALATKGASRGQPRRTLTI